MRCLIAVLALVAVAAGQGNWLDILGNALGSFGGDIGKDDYVIDTVHEYRFEDHTNQNGYHLLVAISDAQDERECHVIEIDSSWEAYVQDEAKLHAITEEIYHLIDSNTAQETTLTRDELRNKYGDTDALRECFNHSVYLMTYNPSQTIHDM